MVTKWYPFTGSIVDLIDVDIHPYIQSPDGKVFSTIQNPADANLFRVVIITTGLVQNAADCSSLESAKEVENMLFTMTNLSE